MRRATTGCHLAPCTRDVKALEVTTDAGDPALGAALAGAALAGAPPSAARLRAVVLRQQANARAAALDDVAGCLTAIEAGFLAVDEADDDPIAGTVADTYGLTLLPPVAIGGSHEHAAWTGTVSISSTTLTSVVRDVSESLRRSRVDRLLIVNGHGGNYVLSNVVQEASVGGAVMALFPNRDDWADARRTAGMVTDNHADMHAGELETSLLLHAIPTSSAPGSSRPTTRRLTVVSPSSSGSPPTPTPADLAGPRSRQPTRAAQHSKS